VRVILGLGALEGGLMGVMACRYGGTQCADPQNCYSDESEYNISMRQLTVMDKTHKFSIDYILMPDHNKIKLINNPILPTNSPTHPPSPSPHSWAPWTQSSPASAQQTSPFSTKIPP
jgi:hypothetical protein